MAGDDLTQEGIPQAGVLIAGKYRVGAPLARGGMGVVCEGAHEALDQRVAIKFLLPETCSKPEIVERFIREARAAAKIQSEHVVRVFDVGSHDGMPYMVMEYLQGGDLARRLEEGALSVDDAVEYVCQALEAIAEAHRVGIVHRDIKPANLFLAQRSNGALKIKVLDFGISKVEHGRDLNAALTSTHVMMGSPGYMSPEQVRSTKSVDARSDVWSIGVVLYELLTGTVAYPGETLGDIFAKIREEQLPPVRSLRPEVPAGLEAVLSRCLQRDREQRLANGGQLLEALSPFRKGRPAFASVADALDTVREVSPRAVFAGDSLQTVREAASAVSATHATWSSAQEPPRREGRRWLLAAGGALIVLLALGALVLTSGSDEHASATTASADPTPASAPAPAQPEPAPQSELAPPNVALAPPPSGQPEALLAPSVARPSQVANPSPARRSAAAPRSESPRPAPQQPVAPAPAKRPATREDLGI